MKSVVLSLCLLLLFIGVSFGSNTTGNLGVSYEQLMADMGGFFPDMKLEPLQFPYYEGTNPNHPGARYQFNIETGFSGEKTENPGFCSVMLFVPIKRDFSDKKMLPYMMMLQTCLRNAIPEWKDDNERNEWLTATLEALIKGASSQYSDLTNLSPIERVVGNKKIRVWLSADVINLNVFAR